MNDKAITKGIKLGLLGGLAGTIIMDLVIVGVFWVVGMPTEMIYSFIGSVAESFFMKIGIEIQGGIPLGATIHLLLGLGLGVIFGIAMTKISVQRPITLKRGMLLGVLYIEVVSQPILIAAPLLVEMSTSDILQWYILSSVMHLIYGIVLGGIVSYKL
jgi:hypothetical protein